MHLLCVYWYICVWSDWHVGSFMLSSIRLCACINLSVCLQLFMTLYTSCLFVCPMRSALGVWKAPMCFSRTCQFPPSRCFAKSRRSTCGKFAAPWNTTCRLEGCWMHKINVFLVEENPTPPTVPLWGLDYKGPPLLLKIVKYGIVLGIILAGESVQHPPLTSSAHSRHVWHHCEYVWHHCEYTFS